MDNEHKLARLWFRVMHQLGCSVQEPADRSYFVIHVHVSALLHSCKQFKQER